VRGGDRVVLVVGDLSAADNVSPHDADLVPGVDIDDFARDGRMEAAVASEICIIHVEDGVVGVRGPDTNELAIVLITSSARADAVCAVAWTNCSVNAHTLSNAVGRAKRRQESQDGCSKELHDGWGRRVGFLVVRWQERWDADADVDEGSEDASCSGYIVI
jgi:hypothetical protein